MTRCLQSEYIKFQPFYKTLSRFACRFSLSCFAGIACLATVSLAACGPIEAANTAATDTATVQPSSSQADIREAVSGTYIGDPSHTYVGLTYMHQGYARATLRVDNVAINLAFEREKPEDAKLTVMMKATNINTGTKKFDIHLMSADFFDAENYPDISFTSTSMTMKTPSTGTITGELTIKDITKPLTLDVTLNKVGQHFRSKADMIGISASGELSRTEWGLGKYAPTVSDKVTLTIEAELAIPVESKTE